MTDPASKTSSPVPKKNLPVLTDFNGAIKLLLGGKKVTLDGWGEAYAYMDGDVLKIWMDSKLQNWIITRVDLENNGYKEVT